MALTLFTVTGIYKAVTSDTSDPSGDPDIENVSSFVYFTPSVAEVSDTTDHIIYQLPTIRVRTNIADGILKNIDGTGVKLVANTANLNTDDLYYTVTFDHTVYNQADQTIDPFKFLAPYTATTIDLSTVERLPPDRHR